MPQSPKLRLKQLIWLGIMSFLACAPVETPENSHVPQTLISIPGATVRLGDSGDPNEISPPREISLESFQIQATEVTNDQFAEFVQATDYQTDAEKKGWGWVWLERRWQRVDGADWQHPQGPDSNIQGLDDHPVVQVSWHDAQAYCQWKNLRLPTEDEWEYAAQGKTPQRYPWGDAAPRANNLQRLNYGTDDCCDPDEQDGFTRTAPVGQYPQGASPFGVLDMAGNVWEWLDNDHPNQTGYKLIHGGGWGNSLRCIRIVYRHANRSNHSLDMVGFRCVR